MDDQLEIARNAGNVSDLGPPRAAAAALKTMLADRIAGALEENSLSVRAAEKRTGFAAADYSRIRQKQLGRFTIDRLLAILGSLDSSIELSVMVRPRLMRDRVIDDLRSEEPAIRARGATGLFLFGSVARDAAGPKSDVDVLIDHDPEDFTLLNLVGVKVDLETRLGVPVHVTTRDSLRPGLRRRVEAEAIRVF